MRQAIGAPDASRHVPSDPPLILDRHCALFEVAKIPQLPAPVMFVHTGGKPLSYSTARVSLEHQSLPGLVTLAPAGVTGHVSLRGIGEGTLIYFEDERRTPRWLRGPGLCEPVTMVDNVIVALTQQLLNTPETKAQDAGYAALLGNTLLAELRHVLAQSAQPAAPRGSRSGLLLAHTAIQHVQQHLDSPLTVAALARRCGLGVTQFSNMFRGVTGATPHAYVRRARIDRACELLRTTSLTIREVAEAVGFSGQSHFCTAFAREQGLTPSAYRRKCHDPLSRR
jgi:AraC family transcriptional regulator